MYKFIKYFSTIVILSINIYGCNTANNSATIASVNSNIILPTDYTPMQQYQSWITNLSNSDYTVAKGSIFLMQNSDCAKFISIFNSCFGQNPAAPYIIPELPVESSYVDPHYATELLDKGPQGESTTNIFYRLNNNDAMMVLVYYPPNAAYFGYQSYVFTRDANNYSNITPPRARNISPNPNRYELFASIGNDINNVVVTNQYLSPWNGNVILYITTPNSSLASQLVANATANGINPNSIFVEPIGDNVITGDGESADDLITLIRYAMVDPNYAEQAANWENSLRWYDNLLN